MKRIPVHRYTLAEEIANSITHGLGVAFAVTGLCLLVISAARTGDPWRIVSFSIYGSSLILLYLFSTIYHSIPVPSFKPVLRYLDHCAIYLLIAGTYTPFLLVKIRGGWGWSLFGVIWGLALAGIVLNFVLLGRSRVLGSMIYIGMGWLVIIALKPLIAAIPAGGIWWLAAGGLSYTFGVVFYLAKKLPFNHAIWHLFVLGGSVCHFLAVWFYVLPV